MALAEEQPFKLGSVEVRPAERELVHARGRETLEPRVMEVLIVLARADGAVVSRDALVAQCWGGRAVTDDAINRVISRLRRAAEQTGGFAIETITKVGYRLTAGAPGATETPKAKRWRPWLLGGAIAFIAALAALFVWTTQRPAAPRAEWPLTLAVMPFEDGGIDHVGEGLPREIRNRLARVRGLRVIADSSSFALAGQRLGAVEIGRRLGADLLLEGGARRDGDAMRLTIELIDAKTGAVAWTDAHDGPADDLSAAEAAISTTLLEHLVGRLGPERVQALAPPRPIDGATHRLVLQARQMMKQGQERIQAEDFDGARAIAQEARVIFEAILERDPENADALVMLSKISARPPPPGAGEGGFGGIPRERGVDLLRRALRADPDNPAALTTLGEVYRRNEWRWREAETLYRRALAIDPNNADAHMSLNYLLTFTGRCREALAHARTASALDPEFTWRRQAVPRALKCLGRFEEADRLYLAELTRDRTNVFLAREMHINLMERRDAAASRALARRVETDIWAGAPTPAIAREIARMRAGADALDGARAPLIAIIDEDLVAYRRLGPDSPPIAQGRFPPDFLWMLTVEAAAIGETERAIGFYEDAIGAGSLYIPETFPYGPLEFTPEMRAHPRYQALWRSDPRLVELKQVRLQSLRAREMAGVLPNGRVVQARSDDWRGD